MFAGLISWTAFNQQTLKMVQSMANSRTKKKISQTLMLQKALDRCRLCLQACVCGRVFILCSLLIALFSLLCSHCFVLIALFSLLCSHCFVLIALFSLLCVHSCIHSNKISCMPVILPSLLAPSLLTFMSQIDCFTMQAQTSKPPLQDTKPPQAPCLGRPSVWPPTLRTRPSVSRRWMSC